MRILILILWVILVVLVGCRSPLYITKSEGDKVVLRYETNGKFLKVNADSFESDKRDRKSNLESLSDLLLIKMVDTDVGATQ